MIVFLLTLAFSVLWVQWLWRCFSPLKLQADRCIVSVLQMVAVADWISKTNHSVVMGKSVTWVKTRSVVCNLSL